MNFPLILIVIGLAVAGFVALSMKSNGGAAHTSTPKPRNALVPPTPRDVRGEFGERKIRESVLQTRPRLAATVEDVRKLPMRECGVFEGLLVPDEPRWWMFKDEPTHSRTEDGKIRIGPPRSGKSLDLKEECIEWPGPLVSTSTKLDILTDTYDLRGGRGFVFNPDGQFHGGRTFKSNLRWNPVVGCRHLPTAERRALRLVEGTSSVAAGADKAFWAEKGHVVLTAFLYVADHLDGSLLMVKRWANDWTDETPFEWLAANATEDNEQLRLDLAQIRKHTDRMRDSIFATIAQMLNCLRHDGIREVVVPKEGETLFDPRRFVASKASLYLIAAHKEFGGIGAIFALIVGEIYDIGLTIARQSPGGRLDPPLLLALDEAPSICRLPLDTMAAEAGGQGIRLSICIQSRSQLYATWGEKQGETIFNTLTVKHIFPGVHDTALLAELSTLAGEKTVPEVSTTHHADSAPSITQGWKNVPRFTESDITHMSEGESLLVYGNKTVVKVRHPYGRAAAEIEKRKDAQVLTPPRPRPPTRGGTPMVAAGETTTAAIVRIHPELADDEEVGESSG